MRRPGITTALAALMLRRRARVRAAPAQAAVSTIPFTPCPDAPAYGCAHLTVPLDPSGAIPGTVSLVDPPQARGDAGAATDAVIALAGGPGQAALPFAADEAQIMQSALATRDLVVFDQRGTGDSGPLSCTALSMVTAPISTGDPRLRAQVGATRGLLHDRRLGLRHRGRSARRSATRSSSSTGPPTARRSPALRRAYPRTSRRSCSTRRWRPTDPTSSTSRATRRCRDLLAQLCRRRLPRHRQPRGRPREPSCPVSRTSRSGGLLQQPRDGAPRQDQPAGDRAGALHRRRGPGAARRLPRGDRGRRRTALRAARDPRRPRRSRGQHSGRSTTRCSSTPSARSCRSRGTAPTPPARAWPQALAGGARRCPPEPSARSARAPRVGGARSRLRLLALRDGRPGADDHLAAQRADADHQRRRRPAHPDRQRRRGRGDDPRRQGRGRAADRPLGADDRVRLLRAQRRQRVLHRARRSTPRASRARCPPTCSPPRPRPARLRRLAPLRASPAAPAIPPARSS